MVTAVIVLAVLSLVLAGAAVWAFVAKGRAAMEAAGARAESRRLVEAIDLHLGERDEARARANASLARVTELSTELAAANERLGSASREIDRVRLDAEKRAKEHLQLEERFKDAFRALSGEALKAARAEFLEQAKPVFEAAKKEQGDLVKPIGETLAKTADRLTQLDERVRQSGALNQQLREETERLTRALSRPEVRGRYGEIQLRRVAELAGMRDYCDFEEQASGVDESGNAVRPDMVVKLPNQRVVAVDAKTNIDAYIQAVNARDEGEREAQLDRFARHVAEQAKKLADKRYWSGWAGSPEFVVMFVPGDHFIDAALSRRPDLLEYAAQHRVILASPSTLIGLLRAVAVGWREQALSEQAQALFELGRELHDRAATAFGHVSQLGDSIRQTTERYNRVVGSIDTRLVPTLKRFEEAGAKSAKELAELKPVEGEARALSAAPEGEPARE